MKAYSIIISVWICFNISSLMAQETETASMNHYHNDMKLQTGIKYHYFQYKSISLFASSRLGIGRANIVEYSYSSQVSSSLTAYHTDIYVDTGVNLSISSIETIGAIQVFWLIGYNSPYLNFISKRQENGTIFWNEHEIWYKKGMLHSGLGMSFCAKKKNKS